VGRNRKGLWLGTGDGGTDVLVGVLCKTGVAVPEKNMHDNAKSDITSGMITFKYFGMIDLQHKPANKYSPNKLDLTSY
jgi:hypothetical protein